MLTLPYSGGSPKLLVYAGSVNHHLLAQYYNSLCAVILQQFENKLICGGMEGVVEMCSDTPILAAMLEEHMGLPLHEMQTAVAALSKGQHVKIPTAKQPKLAFYVRDSKSGSKARLELDPSAKAVQPSEEILTP